HTRSVKVGAEVASEKPAFGKNRVVSKACVNLRNHLNNGADQLGIRTNGGFREESHIQFGFSIGRVRTRKRAVTQIVADMPNTAAACLGGRNQQWWSCFRQSCGRQPPANDVLISLSNLGI